MKRPLTHSFPMKVFAFLLAIACFVTAFCSAAVVAAMIGFQGYEADRVEDVTNSALETYYSRYLYTLAYRYFDGGSDSADEYADFYGFYYRLESMSGEMLATNYSGQHYRVQVQGTEWNYYTVDYYDWEDESEVEPEPEEVITDPVSPEYFGEEDPVDDGIDEADSSASLTYTQKAKRRYACNVIIYGEEVPTTGNWGVGIRLLEIAWKLRFFALASFLVSAVLLLILVIFLFSAAGRRKDRDEPQCNFFDRIPLEIYLGLSALGVSLINVVAWELLLEIDGYLLAILAFGTAMVTLDFTMLLLLSLSIGTRIKTGRFWKNTLVYWGFGLLKRSFAALGRLYRRAALVPKLTVCLTALIFLNLGAAFLVSAYIGSILIFLLMFLEVAVLVPLTIWAAASVERVKEDLQILAGGQFDHRCDPRGLSPSVKSLGEAINQIGEGMESAVQEKVKSERFKTELITNVSHDIKTPLTSIVNFVDLLQKEEIENETVREYLEILDRQSNRLKKLTEDLVEASKASTGNLAMHFETVDLKVLTEQALGEYQEAFEKKQLVPVFTAPEEAALILADGRYLWRVLDNLMNNACKYSVPNTRVYCTLEVNPAFVTLSMLNVSMAPLNIPADELMERFVRGDASRNTEGSGLGLSIARSLVELQRGTFHLTIDGDLFKAQIRFPRKMPRL